MEASAAGRLFDQAWLQCLEDDDTAGNSDQLTVKQCESGATFTATA
jgi:hypothetical protein